MHDMTQRDGDGPRRYLKNLRMDAFGCFSGRDIGPFSPGLNVIYGQNESGKTSMAKFVGGVLFGWEDSRKGRNSYRPKNGSQSGSLMFASRDDDRDVVVCSRARNADGMQQSAPARIADGVDAASFKTVFTIDGDILRSASDPDAMLDRLLTAESGSDASPVLIATEIEKRMKACLSKAASNPGSIANLSQDLSQVRSEIKNAEARNGRLLGYDCELRDIEGSLPALRQAIDRSNAQVEKLARVHDALQRLDAQEEALRVKDESHSAGDEGGSPRHSPTRTTVSFSDAPSEDGQAKESCEHGERPLSKPLLAAFAACCAFGLILLAVSCLTSRTAFAVASVLCLLAGACLGAAAVLRSQGRGLGLIVAGWLKRSGNQASRDKEPHSPRHGGGSKASSSELAAQLASIDRSRHDLCRECGIGEEGASRRVRLLLSREGASRERLQDKLVESSARAGELRRILEDARGAFDLEGLRERESELELRLERAKREYAVLLVAQRALDDAVDAWEASSQPAVYAQAGRLMSLMTNGRWCGLANDPQCGLSLVDGIGARRAAKDLSLGTCQQMYLALRIALLMGSPNVGESLPVIADEILANFDDSRRESAALAIAELARSRQVLFLTCHSELVELMRRASPDVNVLRL